MPTITTTHPPGKPFSTLNTVNRILGQPSDITTTCSSIIEHKKAE